MAPRLASGARDAVPRAGRAALLCAHCTHHSLESADDALMMPYMECGLKRSETANHDTPLTEYDLGVIYKRFLTLKSEVLV